MKTVTIRGVVIGQSIPKICVPIMAAKINDITDILYDQYASADMIEWRMDCFNDLDQHQNVLLALQCLRKKFNDKPIIATFRSLQEGGFKSFTSYDYRSLNEFIIKSGFIDVIDIEQNANPEDLKQLISLAHANGMYVIVSHHNFHRTPLCDEIISRLRDMQSLNADIIKMAVMPKNRQDVLTLIKATMRMNEQYATQPIITMSMGNMGGITRICGEFFGSAITFGSIEKESAPGQLPLLELRSIMQRLHPYAQCDCIK